jgi:hypothetical protein
MNPTTDVIREVQNFKRLGRVPAKVLREAEYSVYPIPSRKLG